MSISPSGSFRPSRGCNLSASHAPPVCSPIIALAGVTWAFSSDASRGSTSSASGSFFTEVLLQDDLRGVGIQRFPLGQGRRLALAVRRPHAAFDFRRAVALVDQLDRQPEAAIELAREFLGAARHLVRRAVLAQRASDDKQVRAPLLHQAFDRGKPAGLGLRDDALQGMRGAQLRLAYRDANAL